MPLIWYPQPHTEPTLPLYVTGIGLHVSCTTLPRMDGHSAQLILTTGGKGSVSLASGTYPLTPGEIWFVPEDTACRYQAESDDWQCSFLLFRQADRTRTALFTSESAVAFRIKNTAVYEKALREIYNTLSADEKYGGYTASALLYNLIIDLNREKAAVPHAKNEMPPAAAAVIAYINAHYEEEISLDMLCQAAGGLSEQYLCRLFKQTIGMRPMEYTIKKRIGIAQACLEKTDMSIEEIVEKTGFHNTSYFYRNFKKFTGTSPLAYRKKKKI